MRNHYKHVDLRYKTLTSNIHELWLEDGRTYLERHTNTDPFFTYRKTFPRWRNFLNFLKVGEYLASPEERFLRWSYAKSGLENPEDIEVCKPTEHEVVTVNTNYVTYLSELLVSQSIALKFISYFGLTIILLLLVVIALLVI